MEKRKRFEVNMQDPKIKERFLGELKEIISKIEILEDEIYNLHIFYSENELEDETPYGECFQTKIRKRIEIIKMLVEVKLKEIEQ